MRSEEAGEKTVRTLEEGVVDGLAVLLGNEHASCRCGGEVTIDVSAVSKVASGRDRAFLLSILTALADVLKVFDFKTLKISGNF